LSLNVGSENQSSDITNYSHFLSTWLCMVTRLVIQKQIYLCIELYMVDTYRLWVTSYISPTTIRQNGQKEMWRKIHLRL